MLFKVISLSTKTDSASFFNSSTGRTALDMCYCFTRFGSQGVIIFSKNIFMGQYMFSNQFPLSLKMMEVK